ncbi:hypothetical protein [Crucian carp herpesvirus]|uniref:ORF43 n=1 Tax=Cyprinid herpesvirus 2 TaxID=317878 RepID=A0A0E3XAL6_CYHV2|nr:hypothetical protein [Cyprinid herpesvirus 2]AMB21614.1 ORF43 [Cyprinid herpesvirus 2]APB92894.1 hypothetical protein [Crucian carp herpesvirus]
MDVIDLLASAQANLLGVFKSNKPRQNRKKNKPKSPVVDNDGTGSEDSFTSATGDDKSQGSGNDNLLEDDDDDTDKPKTKKGTGSQDQEDEEEDEEDENIPVRNNTKSTDASSAGTSISDTKVLADKTPVLPSSPVTDGSAAAAAPGKDNKKNRVNTPTFSRAKPQTPDATGKPKTPDATGKPKTPDATGKPKTPNAAATGGLVPTGAAVDFELNFNEEDDEDEEIPSGLLRVEDLDPDEIYMADFLANNWAVFRKEVSGLESDWGLYWRTFLELCESWECSVLQEAHAVWERSKTVVNDDSAQSSYNHNQIMSQLKSQRKDVCATINNKAAELFRANTSLADALQVCQSEISQHGRLSEIHLDQLLETVMFMLTNVNAIKMTADYQYQGLDKVWTEATAKLIEFKDVGAALDTQHNVLKALRYETEYKLQLFRLQKELKCVDRLSSSLAKARTSHLEIKKSVEEHKIEILKEFSDAVDHIKPGSKDRRNILSRFVRNKRDLEQQDKADKSHAKKIRKTIQESRAALYRIFEAWRLHPSDTLDTAIVTLLEYYLECVEQSCTIRLESRAIQMANQLAARHPDMFTSASGFQERTLMEEPAVLKSVGSLIGSIATAAEQIPYAGPWNEEKDVNQTSRLYNIFRAEAKRDAMKPLETDVYEEDEEGENQPRPQIEKVIDTETKDVVFDDYVRVGLRVNTVNDKSSVCGVYPTCTWQELLDWFDRSSEDGVSFSNCIDYLGKTKIQDVENLEPPVVKLILTDIPTYEEMLGALMLLDPDYMSRADDVNMYTATIIRYVVRLACLMVLSDCMERSQEAVIALQSYARSAYNAFISFIYYMNTGSWTFKLLGAAHECVAARFDNKRELESCLQEFEAKNKELHPLMVSYISDRQETLDWPVVTEQQYHEARGFTAISTWVRSGTCAPAAIPENHGCTKQILDQNVPVFRVSKVIGMPILESFADDQLDPVKAREQLDNILSTLESTQRRPYTIEDSPRQRLNFGDTDDEFEDESNEERTVERPYSRLYETSSDSVVSEIVTGEGPAPYIQQPSDLPQELRMDDINSRLMYDADVVLSSGLERYQAEDPQPLLPGEPTLRSMKLRDSDFTVITDVSNVSSLNINGLYSYYVSGNAGAAIQRYLAGRSDVSQSEIEQHMLQVWNHTGRPDGSFESKEVEERLKFIEEFWSTIKLTHPLSTESMQNFSLNIQRYTSTLSNLLMTLTEERRVMARGTPDEEYDETY